MGWRLNIHCVCVRCTLYNIGYCIPFADIINELGKKYNIISPGAKSRFSSSFIFVVSQVNVIKTLSRCISSRHAATAMFRCMSSRELKMNRTGYARSNPYGDDVSKTTGRAVFLLFYYQSRRAHMPFYGRSPVSDEFRLRFYVATRTCRVLVRKTEGSVGSGRVTRARV